MGLADQWDRNVGEHNSVENDGVHLFGVSTIELIVQGIFYLSIVCPYVPENIHRL